MAEAQRADDSSSSRSDGGDHHLEDDLAPSICMEECLEQLHDDEVNHSTEDTNRSDEVGSIIRSEGEQEAEMTLNPEQSTRLLMLMFHANGCDGNHRSPRLAQLCQSVKLLMLQLQCHSTLAGEPSPLPWRQPCQSLLPPLHPEPALVSQVANPSGHSDRSEAPHHSGDQSRGD